MYFPRSIALLLILGYAFPSWLGAAWEKIHPLGRPTSGISGLAAGNGEWVAVGGRGLITRLTVEDRWGEIPSPIGVNLNDVIHTGDRFIAIGDEGAILLSAPSSVQTWTLTTSGVSQKLLRIGKFDSEYIILGENGLVLRSIDGVTWEIRRPADQNGPKFQSLVKFNSEFVAIEGRKVWRSPDAATWTHDTTADSKVDYVQNARVLNNQLVAWGDFRGMARSDDGRQWTALPCPLGNSSDDVTDIIFASGRYLLTGSDRFQEENRPIYTSTNLTTWTATDGTAARRILAGDGQIVATSVNGHEASTDGLRWRRPDAHLFQPVVFSDGAFRAADRSFLYSSADGRTWARSALPQGVHTSDGIQTANGRYLLSSGTKVSVSDDLTSWQSATLPIGGFVRDFQYAFGKYYALVPRNSFLPYSIDFVIASSSDGLSWTSLSTDASQLASSGNRIVGVHGASNVFYSRVSTNGTNFAWYTYNEPAPSDIAYGNGAFVAVSSSAGHGIRTSADGVTWTRMPTEYGMESVAFVNGRFVARGRGGVILTSTDGLAWNVSTFPLWTKTQFGPAGPIVAHGNGTWLLTRDIPLLSEDLQSFEPLTPPIDQNFVRVRHLDGDYFALSKSTDSTVSGTLWRSVTNGSTWAPLKHFGFNITDITKSPSLYLVLADYNTVAVTTDLENWETHSATLGNARAATYHQGNFFIASGSGLWRSANGSAWEAVAGISGLDAYDIISTPLGITVAGSDGSRSLVYHSTDGEAWSKVWSNSRPQYLRSLAYSDGRLIAGGDYGFLLASLDGQLWSPVYAGDAQGMIEQSVGAASSLLSLSGGTLRRAPHDDLSSHRNEPIPARITSVSHGGDVSIAAGVGSALYRDSATTAAPAPTDFSVSNSGDRFLDLAWNADALLAGYAIEYRVVGTTDWTRMAYLLGVAARNVRLSGLKPGTEYELRILGISSGQSASSVRSVPTVSPTFTPVAHWRNVHFGDPTNTGPGANLSDEDNDGIPNLLEYAIGHDPRASGPSPLTASTAPAASPGYTVRSVEFWCDALNSDIDYVVESSIDLQTWTVAGTSFAGAHFQNASGGSSVDPYYYPNQPPRRKIKVSVTTNQPMQFFRLKILPGTSSP